MVFFTPLPFNDQCSHHRETSQLICSANQLSGFYMMGTLVVKKLKRSENQKSYFFRGYGKILVAPNRLTGILNRRNKFWNKRFSTIVTRV